MGTLQRGARQVRKLISVRLGRSPHCYNLLRLMSIRCLTVCLGMVAFIPFRPAVAATPPEGPDCLAYPPPRDENPELFPLGVFGSKGEFWADSYSCVLRAMGELPLPDYLNHDQGQAFRVLVLPSFRTPMVVRLATKPDGSGKLVVKVAANERFPATLTASREESIPKPQVDRFLLLVKEADFWEMPVWVFLTPVRPASADGRKREPQPGTTTIAIMGGVVWLFEGARGSGYHVVMRKGLNEPSPVAFARLTSYLFRDLAGLEIPKVAH